MIDRFFANCFLFLRHSLNVECIGKLIFASYNLQNSELKICRWHFYWFISVISEQLPIVRRWTIIFDSFNQLWFQCTTLKMQSWECHFRLIYFGHWKNFLIMRQQNIFHWQGHHLVRKSHFQHHFEKQADVETRAEELMVTGSNPGIGHIQHSWGDSLCFHLTHLWRAFGFWVLGTRGLGRSGSESRVTGSIPKFGNILHRRADICCLHETHF